MQTFVFGDSISYGMWDEEGGWVSRLKKYYDSRTILSRDLASYNSVIGLGVSGNTTEDLLNRIEKEIEVRLDGTRPVVMLFQIGINDTDPIIGLQEEKFRSNLILLVDKAKNYADISAFLGILPLSEENIDPFTEMRESQKKDTLALKYNKILKEVCKRASMDFIDLREKFTSQGLDFNSFLFDHVHPNKEGHDMIFHIVKEYLDSHTG